jgi:hypothetical protein
MSSVNVTAIFNGHRISGVIVELPPRMETKQAINGDGNPAAIERSVVQNWSVKLQEIKSNQLRQGNGAGSPFPNLFAARPDKNPVGQLTLVYDTHTETYPKAQILTDRLAILKGTGEDLEIEFASLGNIF